MPKKVVVSPAPVLLTLKKCEQCGAEFTPVRSIKRYCSDNCRSAACYARNVIPVGARAAYRAARRGAKVILFDPRFGGGVVTAGLTRPPGYAAHHSASFLLRESEEVVLG
jgi:hypothetical protein